MWFVEEDYKKHFAWGVVWCLIGSWKYFKKSGFDKEGSHVLTLKETMGKSATGKPSIYIA